MNGKGVYKWANGKEYTGQFKANRINGNGKIVHPDGSTYEGQWQDGV